ncbi:hypothetical protein ACLMJK_004851 [Lecanora helva]
MVGIPGRSKGCATCRRRKIRCDLQQPACRKCTQSGRECEGYARYPVFLNRTPEGTQKRHGLEEAKLSSDTGIQPQDASMLSGVSFLRDVSEKRNANIDYALLVQPNASVMNDQQLMSAFWEKYIPLKANVQDGSACLWLEQVMWTPNKSETLQLSIKALATSRLGWLNRDQPLALQGSVTYVKALQSVQSALWRGNAALDDDLFVAGYVLAVHEMIQCVLYRTSSFLGTDEWQSIPWEVTAKDVYQKLYDKGFILAALFEDIDKTNITITSESLQALSDQLQRLSDLDTQMDIWYRELLNNSPSPMYWPAEPSDAPYASTGWYIDGVTDPNTLPPLEYQTLRLANIITTYWGLRTVLSNTITTTCGTVLLISDSIQTESSDVRTLTTRAQQLIHKHGGTTTLQYAIDIMRSMPYCLHDNMGLLGAQKSLFALRTALSTMRRYPGEEHKWCCTVYKQLEAAKGLRYAKEVAKLDGRQNPSEEETLSWQISKTFLEGVSTEIGN